MQTKEQIAVRIINVAAGAPKYLRKDLWDRIAKLADQNSIPRPSEFNTEHAIKFAIELATKLQNQSPGWNSRRLELLQSTPQRKPEKQRRKLREKDRKFLAGKIDLFYASWEWRRLRYDYLKDKERRCECCGATPEHGVRIVVDHIKPIRHYWNLRLSASNLQMLCDECNMGKGSRDETDWRPSEHIELIRKQLALRNNPAFALGRNTGRCTNAFPECAG